MKFKTHREQQEFETLKLANKRLATIVALIDQYTLMEFGKEVTLTSVFRTKAEHEALYAKTPPDQRPASSPHMHNQAVDLRSSDFSNDQINKMLQFLNCFTVWGGKKKCALYHTVAGNVAHFHIQCEAK